MNISQNHPKSLKILFSTEMWERFAYFGVQSLLVLFMVRYLGISDSKAYIVYGAAGSLLFVTPVIGGYLADLFIGYRSAVILGAILLAFGYFIMIFQQKLTLFIALGLLICGNGFLKPNISTLLGYTYVPGSEKRERGFTIFYMGINAGAILGVVLCGIVAEKFGWGWSFLLAGITLLLGMIIFSLGLRRITQEIHSAGQYVIKDLSLFYILVFVVPVTLIVVALFALLLSFPNLVSVLLLVFMLLLIIYLIIRLLKLQLIERNKLIACLILIAFSIVFWALYQQSPMTLVLFIHRCVNLNVFGLQVPPSSVWSLNGIFLLLFAPFTIMLWRKLAAANRDLSLAHKFSLGIGLMACGYLVLDLSTQQHLTSKVSILWVVLSYALQTLGELCLSPIGLAMIGVLVPARMRGLMMGVWFFALAIATNLAGHIAKLASIVNPAISWQRDAHVYGHAFGIYGFFALVAAIILWFLSPVIIRLSHCATIK